MTRHGRVVGSPLRGLARWAGSASCVTLLGLVAAATATAAPNAWTATGSLGTARVDPMVVALQSGDVMAAGGLDANGDTLATTEIYDPATGQWTAGPTMHRARSSGAAVLLKNGQVLVVGGEGPASGTAESAERYLPTTQDFEQVPDLNVGRVAAGLAVLPDGDALVMGGTDPNGNVLATTEIYDSSAPGFSAGADMKVARDLPMTATLPSGKILVAGGDDVQTGDNALASAEVYDPTTQTFALTGNTMSAARDFGATAVLPDGRVLVAGGTDQSFTSTNTTDIYDPATNAFTEGASMHRPRAAFGMAPLPNGDVLVAGGVDAEAGGGVLSGSPSTEIYDPSADTWTSAGDLPTGVFAFGVVPLSDGTVLEAGGTDGSQASAQAAVFAPASAPGGPTTPPTADPLIANPPTANPPTTNPPAAGRPTPPGVTHPVGSRLDDPAATLRLSGLRSPMTLKRFRRGLRFTVTPSKAAVLRITLTKLRRHRRVLASQRFAMSAHKRSVRLVPSRRLTGHPRSQKVRLTVVATDAAGKRSTVTRTVTITG